MTSFIQIFKSHFERRRMKDAIEQTDAIFALEGFEPTAQTRAIDAAVLAGRVTRSQVATELRDYTMQHKTMRGFIETRSWAVPTVGRAAKDQKSLDR